MNLFEEYCRRHGLRCPVIKRPNNRLHVVFRAKPEYWKTHWAVLQVASKNEQYAPSYFQFSWMVPQHNGAFRTSVLEAFTAATRVEWDDYDIEVIKAAKREDGLEPIKDLREAKLAVWEMFMYAADDRLGQLPLTIRRLICVSLDPGLTLEERMKAQETICVYFQDVGSQFAGRWEQCRIFFDPAEYAGWFADLAGQMRDKEYRQDFANLPDVA